MLANDPVTLPEDGALFFNLVSSYLAPEELARVRRAFDLARREHAGERRRSGELFFTHPLTVAYYLAQYRLDDAALVAALLHDVAEDHGGRPRITEIEERFGHKVAHIVEACSDSLVREGEPKQPWQERKRKYLAYLRTVKEEAVLLVSAADKLHNARAILAGQHAEGDHIFTRFRPVLDHGPTRGKQLILDYYRHLADIYHSDLPGVLPLLFADTLRAIENHPAQSLV